MLCASLYAAITTESSGAGVAIVAVIRYVHSGAAPLRRAIWGNLGGSLGGRQPIMANISMSLASGPAERVVAYAQRRPEIVLAGALGLHLVIWTLLPILVCPNLQLDLAEDIALGRE